MESKPGTFAHFVQHLKLKKSRDIKTWKGETIDQGFDILAVVDLPLLYKQDLEQCADWAMRLWAEYHKASDALNKLTLYNYDGSKKNFRGSGESFVKFLWAAHGVFKFPLPEKRNPIDQGIRVEAWRSHRPK